jgi:iron complex transport system ATP-binding protein
MANAYLETKKLSIGYHGASVVRDISLRVEKGEITALIGPNGAGKSTFLKTVARELPPISGEILLEGKPISSFSYKALSQKMAVILTERIKLDLATCRDIVATGRYPYTGRLGILRPEDEQAVDEAMETVHVLDLAERDFSAISDGQRQRVLLARAICQEPELILLDEPTSFLDVRHKLDLLNVLTRMARKKNITVIMSLHEIDLAEKVADKIITMKGDAMFGCGTPAQIFDENRIKALYDIENGFFDPLFGSIELKKPQGDAAKVFVIAGNGAGIAVYRRLQRENVPFATGVLYENDLDFRLARLLAAQVVSVPAFTQIPETTYEEAFQTAKKCEKVILADESARLPNAPLIQRLEKAGIRILNPAQQQFCAFHA